MSGVLMASGVALCCVFLCLLLQEAGYRGARLLSLAAVVTLLLFAVGSISDIFASLLPLIELGGISEAAECAMKVIGIGYVTGICRDISLDMGQQAVAGALLTVGRVEIILVILPAITDIVKMAINMI